MSCIEQRGASIVHAIDGVLAARVRDHAVVLCPREPHGDTQLRRELAHRAHLIFRRSLRQLAVQDDTVRKARAESRLRQLERIRAWSEAKAKKLSERAVVLLQVERLADAIAEGELKDLALSDAPARAMLAQLIDELR